MLVHATLPTGCAGIVVNESGQNQIVVAPGANGAVTAAQVKSALAPGGAILAQLEVPLDAVEAAAEIGQLFLNPAPARSLPPDLLARTYAMLPNEPEAEALTGIRPADTSSCRAAAARLLDQGPRHVVLTLGEAGCFWMNADGNEGHFPAPVVHVVDTIGAGDAFCGALLFFLSQGNDWPAALRCANHAAALSTTRSGALGAMPTLAEVRAFAPQCF
jgi:ribokinase